MKKLLRQTNTFLLSTLFLLASCQEDLLIEKTSQIPNSSIQLGEKLENPYSLENMIKAYDNLKAENEALRTSDFQIETSHYYVRFEPANEKELLTLKEDTTLVLYEYPLDYEIPEGMTSYKDVGIPDDVPPFQYCSVPYNYIFDTNVNYTVLENLYIPEEASAGRSSLSYDLVTALTKEAFILTGNEYLPVTASNANARGRWTPRGSIKIWDDVIGSTTTYRSVFSHYEYYSCGGPQQIATDELRPIEPIDPDAPRTCRRAVYKTVANPSTPGSYIPVEGIKVRARSWFTTRTGYTNTNGDFVCDGRLSNNVNYLIVWENSQYDIRDGFIAQAYYNGPKQDGEWNLRINGGKSLRFATIHRAAYRYYHKNIGGLKRPNTFRKLKIQYVDGEGSGTNWGNNWQNFIPSPFVTIIPNFKIWGKDSNTGIYHTTNELFSTTIHELGHASHIQLMFLKEVDYIQVSEMIRESWCDAVEWFITKLEYNERGVTDYDDPNVTAGRGDHKQWWFFTTQDNREIYTPVFIDLIDDFNQAVVENDVNRPNEDIRTFSMPLIESQFLSDVYGLHSLKVELKQHKRSSLSNLDIDNYLAPYFNRL